MKKETTRRKAVKATGNTTLAGTDLTEKERLFVAEYLKDFNATRSAVAVGYAQRSARVQGCRLLTKDNVQAELKRLVGRRVGALEAEGESLLRHWVDVLNFDANELTQARRVPCPFCYSATGEPQYTLDRYMKERARHEARQLRMLEAGQIDAVAPFPSAESLEFVDLGRAPRPDCHVCHGHGVSVAYSLDSRTASQVAKRMYCGAENTRCGVRVVSLSKEKAMDSLAKALGLYRDRDEVKEYKPLDTEELNRTFIEGMRKARERQEAVLRSRGLEDELPELRLMDSYIEKAEGKA